MILYDNKSNLLGISHEVLMLLGYDDLEDFNSYTKDVADLFVKKSGYIHKYDGFSWIDYVLHGGSSNKTALLRLKNERLVEVEVSIKEILLTKSFNNMELFYQVDLKPKNKEHTHTEPPKQSRQISKSDLVKSNSQIEDYKKEFIEYAQSINDDFVESINQKNVKKVQKISLKLKSLADILGLDELSQTLKIIHDASAKELSLLFCEYKKNLHEIKQRSEH